MRRSLQWILSLSLLALGARFLAGSALLGWPLFLLALGGFGLGIAGGGEGLAVVAIFAPVLTGLEKFGLIPGADLCLVVFGGYLFGRQARNPRRPLLAGAASPSSPAWALAGEVLLSAVLLSLVWQIARHASPELWIDFWHGGVFRFGHPYAFLTAAYVAAMGLAFFRLLLDQELIIEAWMLPFMVAQLVLTAGFFLLQWLTRVPEAYGGIICFLPYEDISSFGSAAAVSFVFFTALCLRPASGRLFRALGGLAAAAAFVFVVASWSRGAWLSTSLTLACVAWSRLPRRFNVALLAAAAALILWVNRNADNPAWNEHPFTWRLIRLVRVENPVNKDPSRFTLYRKAMAMIAERPWTGHGIGSFYLESVRYGRPGDPYALIPDYAHDAWLLIAAELGLTVAVLGAAMVLFALRRGFGRAGRDNPGSLHFATAAALLAYVLSQVTANSLTEYPSNQLLFWFLMAGLLGRAAEGAGEAPPGATPPPRS